MYCLGTSTTKQAIYCRFLWHSVYAKLLCFQLYFIKKMLKQSKRKQDWLAPAEVEMYFEKKRGGGKKYVRNMYLEGNRC